MKRLVSIAALALFAGCLDPAPKAPVAWNLEVDTDLTASTIVVCPPYEATRFAVLRPDGSVASDAFNVFSSRPATILRAAIAQDSAAPELVVRRLALDCREPGERNALVELQFRTAGKILARAEGEASAEDGDYSKAFSAAFAKAVAGLKAEMKR